MIYGYILVMVTILANGTVTGESINYYTGSYECWKNAIIEEQEAEPGVGFVCIEDTEWPDTL